MSNLNFSQLTRIINCDYTARKNDKYIYHEIYDKIFASCEPYYESKWLITIYCAILMFV